MIGQPEDPIKASPAERSGLSLKSEQHQVDCEAELEALNRLNEATSRLMAINNLPEGLQEMLTATIELMGSDFGNVQVFDDQRHVLTIAVQQGFRQDFLDTYRKVSTEDDPASGRALRTGEPVVIEDVETDPPYAPLRAIARSAGYRGVVSMPLIGTRGTTLGMVSTYFRQPHRPSEAALRHLRWYAQRAASFIGRCHTEEELRASEERLRLATSGADLGIWQWDLSTQQVEWSNQCKLHLGFPLDQEPTLERFFNLLHPKDRDRVAAIMRQSVANRSDYQAEYRVIWPDGTMRWIYAGGRIYSTGNGDSLVMVGVTQDITPRKQAAMELNRMRLLLEEGERIAHLGTWEYIAATKKTVWSPGEMRIYGLSPKDTSPDYQTMLHKFIHSEDAEKLDRTFADALSQETTYESENRIVRPDGSVRFVHDLAYPYFSDDGTLLKYVGVTVDVTDSVATEDSLRKSEERFRLAMDATRDGLWDWDAQTGQCYFSPGYFGMLGYAEGELPNQIDTWVSLLPPDERDDIVSKAPRLLETEGGFELEFRLRHKDGQYRWINSRGQVVQRDANGHALRAIGTHTDITERRSTERQLAEGEERLRLTLEAVDERIWDWNVTTGHVFRSEKYYEIIQCRPEDDSHDFEFFRRLIHPEDRNGVLSIINDHKRGESPEIGFSCRLANATNGTRWIRVKGKAVRRDADGNPLRILGTLTDATDEKHRELDLEHRVHERTGQLKTALEAKSQFVANMSHEIRNPLNTINILASLLAHDSLSNEQAHFVHKIQANVRSLASLIDDILDFSKMESGQYILDIAPFRVAELIDHLKSRHDEAARDKGLAIHWPETPYLPELLGDSKRLQQVLDNLIGNAIKFTEKGDVWCRVSLANETPKDVTLTFEVMDSGIGIQTEIIPKLLQPFTQADSSITRRFGGTGLGLSISKHIVGLMGGEIHINSTPGMGSVFAFTLTLPKAKKVHQSTSIVSNSPERRLEGLCILAVDDDETSLSFIKIVLEREGAIVHTATNGLLAFDWLRDHPSQCHAVLMDIQMPIMDGITATRLIRNELEFKDVPILAVTAGILPDQQQAALDAGITEMFRKPVDIENLVERLNRIDTSR